MKITTSKSILIAPQKFAFWLYCFTSWIAFGKK